MPTALKIPRISLRSLERPFPSEGLHLITTPIFLPPEYCLDILNMQLDDMIGGVKRPGSRFFASNENIPPAPPTVGPYPTLGLFTFQSTIDLSLSLLKATNLDIKTLTSAGTWNTNTPRISSGPSPNFGLVNVNRDSNTVTRVTGDGGAPWVAGTNQAEGIRVGDRFQVIGSPGTYRVSLVPDLSIFPQTIQIEPNWASANVSSANYQIDLLLNSGLISGQGLNPTSSGSAAGDILYSSTVFSDIHSGPVDNVYNDVMYISNGNNPILKFRLAPNPDTTCKRLYHSVASLNPLAPKFMESFAGRLVAANLNENGVLIPQRVRWTAFNSASHLMPGTDSPINAITDSWSILGSGFQDLIETGNDEITGLKKLGEILVAYKKRSIYFGIETRINANPIVFAPRITGRGCIASFSIASFGTFHIFLGRDGVWKLTQSGLEQLDDKSGIYKQILSIINYGKINKVFGFANSLNKLDEYWLAIPSASSGSNNLLFVYNIRRNRWYKYDWKINYATDFKGTAGIITWNQYNAGTCRVTSGLPNVTLSTPLFSGPQPTTVLLNGDNIIGQVFKIDTLQPSGFDPAPTDAGVRYTITSVIDANTIAIQRSRDGAIGWQGGTSGQSNGLVFGISLATRTWTATHGSWLSQSQDSEPITLFADQTGNLSQIEKTSPADAPGTTDNAPAINTRVQTGASLLGIKERQKTLQRLFATIRYSGPLTLNVKVSINQGNSWQGFQSNVLSLANVTSGTIVEVPLLNTFITGYDFMYDVQNISSTEKVEILSFREEFVERSMPTFIFTG